ncbi:MAG: HD domain-containing protein [Acidobacteria bacterium]|nr:HD domain-containing protein [Acidobacteriota bacterium]
MNRTLVLVDHDSRSRSELRDRMQSVTPPDTQVLAGGSPEEALGILHGLSEQDTSIELVIARHPMPGMSGTRFLEIVSAQFPLAGRILLSDTPSLEEAVCAFNNTGIDRYIPMPWDPEDVEFTVTTLLSQREMKRINERLLVDLKDRNRDLTAALGDLDQARHDLERSYIQTIESLAVALEAKDRYTSGHSQRVARFAILIARSLGLPKKEVNIIGQVALLHDIGKIGMLDRILNKPTNLNPEERELVKAHPVIGAQILGPVHTFSEHIAGIKHHHEMYNGTGYPDRLRGREIPIAARIVCLADAFDAMTSTRPYRVGLPLEFAMREMQKMAGRQFCPDCVDAFVRVLKTSGVLDDCGKKPTPAAPEPAEAAAALPAAVPCDDREDDAGEDPEGAAPAA